MDKKIKQVSYLNRVVEMLDKFREEALAMKNKVADKTIKQLEEKQL